MLEVMRASESVHDDRATVAIIGSRPSPRTLHLSVFASSATMDSFLQAVDAVAPANITALVAGLVAGGFSDPAHLKMAEASEVLSVFPTDGEGKLTPPDKSFLRRGSDQALLPPWRRQRSPERWSSAGSSLEPQRQGFEEVPRDRGRCQGVFRVHTRCAANLCRALPP